MDGLSFFLLVVIIQRKHLFIWDIETSQLWYSCKSQGNIQQWGHVINEESLEMQ